MDISGERDQTLNQLLVELDGFQGRDRLVVIAASNLLEKLDPALLRPGRFDRQIFVSPPDVVGRERILRVHTRDKPLDGVDLELVARQTSGLTGADLANICNEAAIIAARRGATTVVQSDFEAALERVVAGMQSRRTLNEHEKRVVAWHEAGHALCAELLPSVDRVHKISIVPRGRLLDYMTVLLGGRAAEQIVFGSITTGASDDLKRVAEISHSMIHDYAMGTEITSMRMNDGGVSEHLRRVRDSEQRSLTDDAFRHSIALITRHRSRLDALATTLLEREVLERPDIDRIMDGVEREQPRAAAHLGIAAARGEDPQS
jgi:cell division protease FtsH